MSGLAKLILFSLVIELMAGAAIAQEVKWTHYGLRPLGMGNAYVAVADDFNALFYNPAGLARLKAWDGELLNPHFEASQHMLSFIDKATSLAGGGSDSVSTTLDLLEEQSGKIQHFAIGLTPHLIFKGFGIGLGLEMAGTMVFQRYPSVYLDVGPRLIAPISYARNFLEDRLSIGMSVKFLLRGGVNHDFSIQDIEAFNNKSGSEGPKLEDYVEGGSALGADFGLLFTPIKTMEPTLGISIADVGGTAYEKFDIDGSAVRAPESRLPSVNVGFSLKPLQTGRSYLLASMDVHSVNQPFSFSKKFNVGVEYGFGSILKLQTGLHQGYLTGGIQIDVGLLNLRMITYAEELGVAAGEASMADRRYALQFKLLI